MDSNHLISSSIEVLTLFLIPIGGGIPAGVVLAKTRGLEWPSMAVLYFISDIILACAFEPLMYLFLKAARHSEFLRRFVENYKMAAAKMGFKQVLNPSVFSLVMISFGVDPMTGRSAAKAAGHGFFSGWAIAITGDMFYFALILACTLWLNNVLGDGTWTVVIITVAMIGIPILIDKLKTRSITRRE